MKRRDMIAQHRNQSLADLKQDLLALEKKIQEERLAISFGQSKRVRTIRSLKREVAQCLTIAAEKMSVVAEGDK